MKPLRQLLATGLFLAVSVLTACYSTIEPDEAQIRVIHQSAQCLNTTEGLSLVSSEDELSSIMAAFIQYSLDGEVLTELPVLNVDSELVLNVSLGQRPTAGYGLFLASNSVDLMDQVLVIDVQSFEPSGERVAQMMTNPCLLIAIPLTYMGAVNTIEAMGYRLDL